MLLKAKRSLCSTKISVKSVPEEVSSDDDDDGIKGVQAGVHICTFVCQIHITHDPSLF